MSDASDAAHSTLSSRLRKVKFKMFEDTYGVAAVSRGEFVNNYTITTDKSRMVGTVTNSNGSMVARDLYGSRIDPTSLLFTDMCDAVSHFETWVAQHV
jgi:hypothetical protein